MQMQLPSLSTLFLLSLSATSVNLGYANPVKNSDDVTSMSTLREEAAMLASSFCSSCSVGIRDYQDPGSADGPEEVGELVKLTRKLAKEISDEEYGGKAIPASAHLQVCTIITQQFLSIAVEEELANPDSTMPFVLLDAPPELRQNLLAAFSKELETGADDYNCNDVFSGSP